MRYGLFDTVDQLWLGDDDGPRTFGEGDLVNGTPLTDTDAKILARCAAEAACHTVEWDPTRVDVREIAGNVWRRADSVPKTRTELHWLVRKERGTIV